MEPQFLTEIWEFFKAFGAPGVFVLGLLRIIWYCAQKVGEWGKPLATEAIQKHSKLVDTLTETQSTLVRHAEKTTTCQEKACAAIVRATHAVEELCEGHDKQNAIKRHMADVRRELE